MLILIYYLSTFVYGHAFDLSIDISTYNCLSFQTFMPLNQLITNNVDCIRLMIFCGNGTKKKKKVWHWRKEEKKISNNTMTAQSFSLFFFPNVRLAEKVFIILHKKIIQVVASPVEKLFSCCHKFQSQPSNLLLLFEQNCLQTHWCCCYLFFWRRFMLHKVSCCYCHIMWAKYWFK